jgi:WD40 repeat protein
VTGAALPVDAGMVDTLAWHPDGERVASTSELEATVRIWDARDGTELSLAALRGRPVLIIDWARW